eukprot:2467811-Pleurochrysis_carterae.AAC.1
MPYSKKLINDHVLGKPIANLYVVGQQCGLLHAHILIITDVSARLRDPGSIDKVISTELPMQ